MTALLRDARLAGAIDETGFATTPLLGSAEVDRLRRLATELHPQPGIGFSTDFAYLAVDRKRYLAHQVEEVVRPALERVLGPFQFFNASFVIKWPGPPSPVPLHQDWAYVDERRHRALTVWIPLVDVDEDRDNGVLGFVPGSHRVPAALRGASSIPWYLPYRDALRPHLRPLAVPAGNAAIFDCRVLHGSATNRSDHPRIAIASMVAAADVPLRYHHLAEGRWHIHEVDPDFFCRHSPLDLRARPITDAPVVAVVDDVPARPPLDELADVCGIRLDPVPAVLGEAATRLAGLPLGGSEPAGGKAARALHRAIERRSASPISTPAAVDDLARVAPRLRSLWPAAAGAATGWEHGATSDRRGFRWLPLPVDGPAAIGPLRTELDRAVGPEAAWVVELAAGAELRPGRAGHNGDLVVTTALVPGSAMGSLVLQVDGRIEALDEGTVHAFDPTERHTIRNLGGATAYVLCVAVRRPLGPALRAVRAGLARIGVLPPTNSICVR